MNLILKYMTFCVHDLRDCHPNDRAADDVSAQLSAVNWSLSGETNGADS